MSAPDPELVEFKEHAIACVGTMLDRAGTFVPFGMIAEGNGSYSVITYAEEATTTDVVRARIGPMICENVGVRTRAVAIVYESSVGYAKALMIHIDSRTSEPLQFCEPFALKRKLFGGYTILIEDRGSYDRAPRIAFGSPIGSGA